MEPRRVDPATGCPVNPAAATTPYGTTPPYGQYRYDGENWEYRPEGTYDKDGVYKEPPDWSRLSEPTAYLAPFKALGTYRVRAKEIMYFSSYSTYQAWEGEKLVTRPGQVMIWNDPTYWDPCRKCYRGFSQVGKDDAAFAARAEMLQNPVLITEEGSLEVVQGDSSGRPSYAPISSTPGAFYKYGKKVYSCNGEGKWSEIDPAAAPSEVKSSKDNPYLFKGVESTAAAGGAGAASSDALLLHRSKDRSEPGPSNDA